MLLTATAEECRFNPVNNCKASGCQYCMLVASTACTSRCWRVGRYRSRSEAFQVHGKLRRFGATVAGFIVDRLRMILGVMCEFMTFDTFKLTQILQPLDRLSMATISIHLNHSSTITRKHYFFSSVVQEPELFVRALSHRLARYHSILVPLRRKHSFSPQPSKPDRNPWTCGHKGKNAFTDDAGPARVHHTGLLQIPKQVQQPKHARAH